MSDPIEAAQATLNEARLRVQELEAASAADLKAQRIRQLEAVRVERRMAEARYDKLASQIKRRRAAVVEAQERHQPCASGCR